MISEKIWTIKRLLEWATSYLNEKGIDDSRLNAELLLCHALKYQNRIDLYLHFDKPLRQSELDIFKVFLKRRLTGEPVQYIIGETEFMGFKFKVDSRVLIPRPETELLVESVLKLLKKIKKPGLKILEIGTGCGNISISIAKLFPDLEITAIDSSKSALEVAELNIKNHGLSQNIKLMFINIFDDVPKLRNFDIIVSNPPYISIDEYQILSDEIKNFEPKIALTDGKDGLSYHYRIADIGRSLLNEIGWLFLEIGYDQKEEVVNILEKFGYFDVEVMQDYGGNDRIVKAKWSR